MAFDGGIKFFDNNIALAKDGASMTASSGSGTTNFALDRNPNTSWRSVGSNDATTETLTLTLPSSLSFDSIFVISHNWEEFIIDYDDGGFTDFANVTGLDGDLGGGITETAFSDDTLFYTFDEVTTDTIRFRITTTQTPNEEKRASQIVVTTSIGDLLGFPELAIFYDLSPKSQRTEGGRSVVSKNRPVIRADLNFANYPLSGVYSADISLIENLFDRKDPFLTWLCGGNRGSSFSPHSTRGMRLIDLFPAYIENAYEYTYTNNLYLGPTNFVASIVEAV